MNSIIPSYLELLQRKSFAEFFAGIGLVRAGLERQGWAIAFANDIDPLKQQMYKAHFTNANENFVLEDIFKLNADDIPSVTLATASFPCKDLSLAGSFTGFGGDHSSELWGLTRILERMKQNRPPLIMLENVTGFLSAGKGGAFRVVLQNLNDLGYTVDAFILDAANFVPQSRQRLFVIGLLEEIFPLKQEDQTSLIRETDTRPKQLISFIKHHPTIRWRIRPLPLLPVRGPLLETIIEDVPENDPIWWSQERAEYLLSQMSHTHHEIAMHMIQEECWSYGTVFRRMRNGRSTAELRTDGIAGCLRTPGGGSAKQILFKAGYGRYRTRLINPREAARLMGAGDYQITVPFDQALLGFGDAVCVPVIEWIAANYLNPVIEERLGGKDLRSEMRMDIDRLHEKWHAEIGNDKGATSNNGALCGGITIVENLLNDYTLDIEHHQTNGGIQLKGAGIATGNKVLERFNASEHILADEFGRTSRGEPLAAKRLIELLKPLHLESLSKQERNDYLLYLQENLVRSLLETLRLEKKRQDFKHAATTEKAITALLQSVNRVSVGTVAEHLVGAALELKCSDFHINYTGDFLIQDAVIHVTMAPQDVVYEKCVLNLAQAHLVYLLVPAARITLVMTKAMKYGIENAITVWSIEAFVAQAVDESAHFSKSGVIEQREALVRIYNRRVNEAKGARVPLLRVENSMLLLEESGEEQKETYSSQSQSSTLYAQASLFESPNETGEGNEQMREEVLSNRQ